MQRMKKIGVDCYVQEPYRAKKEGMAKQEVDGEHIRRSKKYRSWKLEVESSESLLY